MSNTIKQAAALLRSIARLRGLAQGGEQSPNVEECFDMAGRLESTAAEVATLRSEVAALRAALARHKTAAGPAETPWQRAVRVAGVTCATSKYSFMTPRERFEAGCPATSEIWDDRADESRASGEELDNPNPETTP